VTHVFSSVLQIADKIGVMDQGRLIAQGEPEKVLKEKNVIEAFMGVIHESTN
jgi:ABC-type branched-chain amino acid transport systems, ATPase component